MVIIALTLPFSQNITLFGQTLTPGFPSFTLRTSDLLNAFRRTGPFGTFSSQDFSDLILQLGRGLVQVTVENLVITTPAQMNIFIDSALGFPGDLEPIENPANLALLVDDLGLMDGELIYVQSLSARFILDKTSVAPVNGVTVLATKSGTGRWLLFTFTTTSAVSSVVNIAALSALAVTGVYGKECRSRW